jgi:two-component system cell cycle response regulator
MDGLEVCRRLKADPDTRYIPVVMVTALSDVSDRLKGLEVGADDFLTKPVNDLALFARVRSLIRLKRTLDEWLLREDINGRLAALPGELVDQDIEKVAPARMLVLEDNLLAGSKLAQILTPHASELTVVRSNAEAQLQATQGDYDLLIISMSLEKDDPLRLLSQLRAAEQTRHLPVVLILDEGDNARLAKGLDLGANDYIIRPVDRNELIARSRIQVRRKRLQEQLLDNYKRGLALALTDGLTNLYNRRYLTAHLESLLSRPGAPAKELALLMFDIDHFKQVNDTWGHAIGDEVLVEVAKRALSNIRGFDLAARYGGEEFVIVLPETNEPGGITVAERLRRAIADVPIKVATPPGEVTVTISIGVMVSRPERVETLAELLKGADEALYAAKHAGRNKVMVAGPDGPFHVATDGMGF